LSSQSLMPLQRFSTLTLTWLSHSKRSGGQYFPSDQIIIQINKHVN
jgi:hypothetical protein